MRILRIAVILLVAPLLFGQLKESVTVEVIDVPVYVIKDNGPVRNLKKENFELIVNGKRQQIDYFDTIDFADVEQRQQAAARDPRDRRLFLFLFDLAFTRPAAIDRARKAAVAVINASAPTDYFAVATFSPRKGAEFVAPFTNDKAVARRAAITLTQSETKDPLSLAISSQERTIYTFNSGREDGEIIMDPSVKNLTRWTADLDNRSMQAKRVIEDQINGFDAIGSRLEQLEGYKHVIVLSEGFSPGLVYANPYTTDAGMMDAMNTMFAAFKRANALIDTIDLGSSERNSFMSDALRLMAQETGGQFIRQTNDIKAAMQRISSASAYGYRLGFHASSANTRSGNNTIDVRLRDVPRGATLSFRRGFSMAKGTVSPFDGLRLADIILNDVPQSGIAPIVIFEEPYLQIGIPEAAVGAVAAEVLMYIFDANGNVLDFKQKRVPVAGIVRTNVELPAGAYVAKVLLRSGDSVGFARQQFVIR